MGTKRELAESYFMEGYNCTQSIVKAFEEYFHGNIEDVLRLACSFGGGMGRLREVCGAFSGALFVLGAVYGYGTPETGDVKKEQYERVQSFAHKMEALEGSIVCRELLHLDVHHDAPKPDARTPEYYKKRPCKKLIGDVAEILEQELACEGDNT